MPGVADEDLLRARDEFYDLAQVLGWLTPEIQEPLAERAAIVEFDAKVPRRAASRRAAALVWRTGQ